MTEDEGAQFKDIAENWRSEEATEAEQDIALREEIAGKIEQLKEDRLGRAIVIRKQAVAPAPGPDQSDMAKLAEAIHPPERHTEDETIGYSLPANRDNTSHLVFFTDGEIIVTNVSNPLHNDQYRVMLAPNDEPLFTGHQTVGEVKDHLRQVWKVSLDNKTPESAEQMQGVVDQATTIAGELKVQRDATRRASNRYLLGKIDTNIFRRGQEPPQHGAPPPDAPPAPPQQ